MKKQSTNYYRQAKCKNCNKEFLVYIYNLKKGFGKYCSKYCSNKANNLGFKKGHPSFLTEEHYRNIGIWHKGKRLSQETKDKISKANKGRIISEEERELRSKIALKRWDIIGRKPQWKNRYKDSKYLRWHRKVFVRDNFTCQNCGQVGGNLEAHHIKEWKNYPELRYLVENGQTLCKLCHSKTDNYKNKIR